MKINCRKWTWISLTLALSGLTTFAANPSWWQTRAVIDGAQTSNDFAAVNVGQLKNIAAKARDEMEASLPGGSSSAIQSLITSFSQTAQDRNDFAGVNVGQAKNVAKLFYDRLIQIGYCTTYPWSDNDPNRNDYAAVNVGQIKNLFSFNLILDSNQNGLPDWWEIKQFGSLGVANGSGSSDYDSDMLTNSEEFWLMTNPSQAADTGTAATSSIGLVMHTDLQ